MSNLMPCVLRPAKAITKMSTIKSERNQRNRNQLHDDKVMRRSILGLSKFM